MLVVRWKIFITKNTLISMQTKWNGSGTNVTIKKLNVIQKTKDFNQHLSLYALIEDRHGIVF